MLFPSVLRGGLRAAVTGSVILTAGAVALSNEVTFELAAPLGHSLGRPMAACLADLDGDEDHDVLTVDELDDVVLWLENTDGQGDFDPPHVIGVGLGGVASVCAADIDRDGDMDVVAASGSGTIAWYRNLDGLGQFAGAQIVGTGITGLKGLEVIDVNRDRYKDIVVCSPETDDVVWFANIGGLGAFSDARLAAGGLADPALVRGVDVDGDGDRDLLVAGAGPAPLVVLENLDGNGVFGPPQAVSSGPVAALDLLAADLDQDQDMDLVLAGTGGAALSFCENLDGKGTYGPAQPIASDLAQACCLATADVDLDGDLDLVVGGSTVSSPVLVWLENQVVSGTLGPPLTIAEGLAISAIAAGGIDDDRDPDVLWVSAGTGGIGWVRNLGPWLDVGHALAGTDGEPRLKGDGFLSPGSPLAITLDQVLELGLVHLVVGTYAIGKPFKAGVMVPAPDMLAVQRVPLGSDSLAWEGIWPVEVPSGLQLYLQAWIVDPAAPQGWAASNGLCTTAP